MDQNDRRVLRTRRLLKQALIELINERSYEEITIRDITDRADIGYATFFRHYDGKDDLMLEIFTGIVDELEALPDRHVERYFEREGYMLFEHVRENHVMYRGILESRSFAPKFRKHIADMVQMHLYQHAKQIPSHAIPLEIAANHMVSSILGLIEWWLSNDMPYSSERMAMVYQRLIIEATWHALNPDNPMVLPM